MIDPNWITAIATAAVAVTGPIALASWTAQRRDAREREREERTLDQARREFVSRADETEREQRLLERADGQSVPRQSVYFAGFLALLGLGIFYAEKQERKKQS